MGTPLQLIPEIVAVMVAPKSREVSKIATSYDDLEFLFIVRLLNSNGSPYILSL